MRYKLAKWLWYWRARCCDSCHKVRCKGFAHGCGAAGGIDTMMWMCYACFRKDQLEQETYGEVNQGYDG